MNEDLRNKTPFEIEYRIIAKDGSVKWIRDKASPMLNNNGEVTGINGFMENVTERKRLEEELKKHIARLEELVEERTAKLRESERRFREIAELLPESVFETDEKDNITFFNKTAVETFGYTANEIANGSMHFKRLPPKIEEELKRIFEGE